MPDSIRGTRASIAPFMGFSVSTPGNIGNRGLAVANTPVAVYASAPKKRFALDVTEKRLESAPGFDNDNWPNMSDQTWAKGIHTYYGTAPTAG